MQFSLEESFSEVDLEDCIFLVAGRYARFVLIEEEGSGIPYLLEHRCLVSNSKYDIAPEIAISDFSQD